MKSRLEHEEKEQQRQAAITYLNNMVNEFSEDIGKTLFFDGLRLSKDEKLLVANEAIKILRVRIEKANGFSKENIHSVSSIERHELLSWIQVSTVQVPSELKELSSRLKELQSENEITKGYIFNAPSDDALKPLFIKLGQLHEELGMLQQKQAIIEKEIVSIKFQLTMVTREQDKLSK